MNHLNLSFRATLCAFVGTALLSGCALSRNSETASSKDDARITADVRAALGEHPDLGPPNQISVDTRGHIVYLTGTVDDSAIGENAILVARAVPGVNDVVSNVSVDK